METVAPAAKKSCLDLIEGIPPRTWVALSADESRVVATGSTCGEAVDNAEANGEKHPILMMSRPGPGISLFGY
jgi:hypothetical protein